MQATTSMEKVTPRQIVWSSSALLQGLGAKDVTASQDLRQAVRHDLWGDMCAEHDAENLWHYLQNLPLDYSPAFKAALEAWREDEKNHYIGLRQICSAMYGVTEAEIDAEMVARIPDFNNIDPFLMDEFCICIVLAYDELVSARGYNMFFEDFREFGPKAFATWVRWAARDESLHYQNFLDIARYHHPHRLGDAAGVIAKIADYERQESYIYRATFLLDHTVETFSREFLHDCGQAVLTALTPRSSV